MAACHCVMPGITGSVLGLVVPVSAIIALCKVVVTSVVAADNNRLFVRGVPCIRGQRRVVLETVYIE